jgi:hypothetical protein
MAERDWLEAALFEFRRAKRLAEGAMSRLSDAQFFSAPSEGENPVAILVKHLAGNARSRWRDFLASDGEKPDRHRDAEFELAADDTRESLMRRWEQGWALVFEALEPLEPLTDRQLQATITIRGESHSVGAAILRQVHHYGYHVGQIVQRARHLRGRAWKTLSVPRGGSESYNARMRERFPGSS